MQSYFFSILFKITFDVIIHNVNHSITNFYKNNFILVIIAMPKISLQCVRKYDYKYLYGTQNSHAGPRMDCDENVNEMTSSFR